MVTLPAGKHYKGPASHLDGALALREGHDVALTITKDLDLNVACTLCGGRPTVAGG